MDIAISLIFRRFYREFCNCARDFGEALFFHVLKNEKPSEGVLFVVVITTQ